MQGFREEQCSSAHIGHLGLVADKIDSLGLTALIDERMPVSEAHGARVSHGERVAAMIFNGLGFIDSRLYLFTDFLEDKPLDLLFGRDVKAEWFNDDALGRCLDEISAYGSTKFLTELSLTIGDQRDLIGKSINIDTTTLSLYGEYPEAANQGEDEDQASIPRPERGYAKSKRHDLKQMVLLLATTGGSNFPIWMEPHSGNASDQKTMPHAAMNIKKFCEGIASSSEFIYVGDSAIYSNILQYSDELQWITRVPERYKEAKELVSTPKEDLEWTSLENGYQYSATTSNNGGVDQRWILFFSEAAYQKECKTLDRTIKTETKNQEKVWEKISKHAFGCKDDALSSIKELEKKLKYHSVKTKIIEVLQHARPGRPKANEEPTVVGYQVEYTLSTDDEKIAETRAKKGRFILATNEMDETALPCGEVLKEYKAQSGTESGFKFIKDDTFQVDSVFLKTPERINALMAVMTLCLMIYGVTQYELRQSLQEKGETVLNQAKKPTDKPSLKWIYFLFRVVNEFKICIDGKIKKIVVNVNGRLQKILKHFGKRAQAIYFNSS
tara:strand:+ start:316 stop:1980 length:1665 start_codon:yes stop_codon:yes gene_type:complete